MKFIITQLFLLIAPILHPSFKPSHITALVAYSHDSHSIIGSMLKAIKTLQQQVATLQKTLKESGHSVDDNHKPPVKCSSSPTLIPSSAMTAHEDPL